MGDDVDDVAGRGRLEPGGVIGGRGGKTVLDDDAVAVAAVAVAYRAIDLVPLLAAVEQRRGERRRMRERLRVGDVGLTNRAGGRRLPCGPVGPQGRAAHPVVARLVLHRQVAPAEQRQQQQRRRGPHESTSRVWTAPVSASSAMAALALSSVSQASARTKLSREAWSISSKSKAGWLSRVRRAITNRATTPPIAPASARNSVAGIRKVCQLNNGRPPLSKG